VAIFHRARIEPTKDEILSTWPATQPWGPPEGAAVDVIGSYRIDDPDGRVGMESFLFTAGGQLLHVPLTYRDEPLAGAEDALITEMSHSVLGNRWVYDALRDPRFVVMLAGVTMTGQGEALGMAVYEGRWYVAPTAVRIRGGGWTQERVPVDRFERVSDDATASVLRNDRFEMTVSRRPRPEPPAPMQLTATWPGQAEPVVLAAVVEL
jgi:hypothetical protein